MNAEAKRILLLGGTGFVGRELGRRLCERGFRVVVAARRPEAVRGRLPFPCEFISWSGPSAPLPAGVLTGCDGVVNLIGEGIADKSWTHARRDAILSSRVGATASLAAAIRTASQKPRVVIQASAIGYYGDRGDATLSEGDEPGRGFLAETCAAWEGATSAIEALGVRLVKMRIGMVLGLTGGALPRLLGIYAKGLGGKLGSGRQWMSWIHIDDLTAMIIDALERDDWRGSFNATAPQPCRNAEFNTALGRNGRYSARLGTPALALRVALGARAALMLDSARVSPKKALMLGFRFRHECIDDALVNLLGDSVGDGLRRVVARQWVPIAPARVWPFFTAATNLERITPPWLGFKVLGTSTPHIGPGTVISYSLKIHRMPVRWESEIKDWDVGHGFVDTQLRGPYSVWHHRHSFEPLAGGTLMTDSVQYRLPVAPLGELIAGPFVERDVEQIFAYRAGVVANMGESEFG